MSLVANETNCQPSALRVNFEGIPDRLKAHPHWVLWCYKWDANRSEWTKVPKRPNRRNAASNKPATWCSYADAVEAYTDDWADGIGVVLTADDDLFALDFDACDLEAAKPYLLDTYTERSPGGNGLRQFGLGKKPEGAGCKRQLPNIKQLEIYEHDRFMTVTGHTVWEHADVEPCEDALAALCARLWSKPGNDTDVLHRIRQSAQGAKFAALFDQGDASAYDDDHSSADLALADILGWATGWNREQTDRLFRQSALYRPKWDERHASDGRTYGQMTLDKAFEGKAPMTAGDIERLIESTDEADELLTVVADALNKASANESQKHRLRKMLAKKAGTTVAALQADAAADQELPPTQLELAQRAIAEFGDGNLIHAPVGFYAWQGTGVWLPVADHPVRQRIHRVCPDDELSGGRVDSVLKLVKTETFIADTQFGKPFDGINVPQGELHYQGGKWRLEPHRKERYSITQLGVDYDPNAKAPRFSQFLEEIFDGDPDAGDKARLLLELMGYTLLPTCRYEKFALLVGNGANGKSVVLGILEAMLGMENVASVAPDQLDNRFQRGYLHGRLANIVTEIAEGAIINDAALKALTSGEVTTAERKYCDPFTFRPYATAWFATNHMPHTRDFSDALFRRACVLTFNNRFEGDRRDPLLKDKLLTELPGILNLCLAAIARVFETGAFTEPASTIEAARQWRLEADQVAQFVEECCRLHRGEVRKRDLYGAYEQWCDQAGVQRPLKHRTFSNRLERLGIGERRTGADRFYTGVEIIRHPIRNR